MKNNWNRDLFNKAWHFATIKHSGQKYGGQAEGQQIDYLNHIGSVTMEILWFMQNTDSIFDADLAVQCAILHDTIEDTETSLEEIIEIFGNQVAQGVLALTKNETLAKKDQMLDSLTRIKLQPKEIWLVKMADRISNLSAPPFYWKKEKIKLYQSEAKLILSHLQEADELMSKSLSQKIEQYSVYL